MTPSSEQLAMTEDQTGTDTPERLHRRWIGMWISIVGIVVLVPMMACAVFIAEGRGLFALAALGAWIVWKVGRTMIKLNSPEEIR